MRNTQIKTQSLSSYQTSLECKPPYLFQILSVPLGEAQVQTGPRMWNK